MRIESTDASSMALANSQETRTVTKENKHISVVESKHISQMTAVERKELPISEKVVIEAIEKANKAFSGGMRKFEFSIHEKTKEIMVKVIDAETNEVVREIPPEKILDMVATIWEMAGIVVDERR